MEVNVEKAEDRWLKNAVEEVQGCFKNVWLPSHDYIHHLRVWEFAKDIVQAYEKNGDEFTYEYIEALLLACMFHDAGLSVTIDESHGDKSKEITQAFFEKNPLVANEYMDEMLEAIVLHDDKTYSNVAAAGSTPGLYQVLTVADDLDAMGALGLYRYIEIYYSRGIGTNTMLSRIEENIKSRIKFIRSKLEFDEELFQRHYERYQRAFYYIKLLTENDLENIVGLFAEKITINDTILFNSFTHSNRVHDFLSEVIVEEKFLLKALPDRG